MQLWLNNWSAALTAEASAVAGQLTIDPAAAALLVGLGTGDHYLLTLVDIDESGQEVAWEIVTVTAQSAGVLDVLRGQEGTSARLWAIGTPISVRVTRGTLEQLRDNAGAALSDAAPQALGAAAPGTAEESSRADHVHPLPTPAAIGAATAAQGATADSAVQPGDLAAVATSGNYSDLIGTPTIPALSDALPQAPGAAAAGTSPAASRADHVHPLPTPAAIGAATAAQGVTADSAVQPADLAAVATSGNYSDLTGTPAAAVPLTEKGAANGVATLDANAKVPLAQLPASAITNTYVVASEAAMLALTAETGDVAIRTDISTSFILAAEPASTLANWQEILAPASGGGAPVGSAVPQPLGTATPGVSTSASRQDHVHEMPSAADVGADPAGAAATAQAAAVQRSNHTGTQLAATISDLAEAVLDVALTGLSLADSALVAATDTVRQAIGKLAARLALAFDRANHTGSQAISTVTGLQTALDGKEAVLTAGTNVTIDRTNPAAPVISAAGGGEFTGGTLSTALNEAPLTTLASASTTNIGAEAANTINISGTTTITSFGTIASGAVRRLVFQGALTLTHNATSLILPTGANITTAAGDSAEFVSLGSGNWRCTDYLRASGEPLAGGGGGSGLTHLTEAKNTSAPNATVPVVSLSVTITETNGDVAFVPKGTGALMAAMPTGTASGGNKRGTHATDWQTNRSSATQVASGNYACITGGQQCTASGSHAVAGGYFAEASGAQSIAIGGQSASATAQYATAIGGNGPLANQQYATAIGGNGVTVTGSSATGVGGESNIIDGPLSSVCGGARATTRGVYGVEARAAGRFSANGDAQRERFVLRRATTDATPAVLSADGGSPAAATQVTLPNNAAYGFTGRLVARASASGDCASWEFKGTIRRGANAAATALVSAVSPTLVAGDSGAAAWTVSVTADTTLGCLSITATGAAATNIKWVADVETVEVVG
ncbi:hypothetical protein ACUTAF_08245 [Pseudomonas sp. SP16.1]|uniref:hypothetical protein n=1 Tax=Pseudomonas sp. SP16.1 TaxID=3458854 RepID=UPI00404620E5